MDTTLKSWGMTTTNTLSRKSHNRVKSLLGSIGVGERIDLGKPHAKGYRLTVGRTTSGTQARFWLGHSEPEAQQRAQAIVAMWADLTSAGIGVWSPQHIAMAKELGEKKVALFRQFVGVMKDSRDWHSAHARSYQRQVAELQPEPGLPSLPATSLVEMPEPSKATTTLYGAMDAYEQALAGKRVSAAHRWRTKQCLGRVKLNQPDVPMSKVDYAFLDRIADFWKARPVSKRKGTPLAAATVVNILQVCRAFFSWVDDTTWGGWEGPRKLTRPFNVERKDLMTPQEVRKAATIEQLDIPSIVAMYRAGKDYQRAIILTALFSGSTQMELAVLTKEEFNLNAGLLDHYRHKTGVRGLFWMPPELIKLLQSEFKEHTKKPLAFYTRNGNPLVTFEGDKKVCDSVLQMWNRLKTPAKRPDALPVKYLRKFAGDYATRHGGEALGQAMLSHAPTSVLGKHYTSTRDFEALHTVQQKLYAELVAAGMFKEVQKEPSTAA